MSMVYAWMSQRGSWFGRVTSLFYAVTTIFHTSWRYCLLECGREPNWSLSWCAWGEISTHRSSAAQQRLVPSNQDTTLSYSYLSACSRVKRARWQGRRLWRRAANGFGWNCDCGREHPVFQNVLRWRHVENARRHKLVSSELYVNASVKGRMKAAVVCVGSPGRLQIWNLEWRRGLARVHLVLHASCLSCVRREHRLYGDLHEYESVFLWCETCWVRIGTHVIKQRACSNSDEITATVATDRGICMGC